MNSIRMKCEGASVGFVGRALAMFVAVSIAAIPIVSCEMLGLSDKSDSSTLEPRLVFKSPNGTLGYNNTYDFGSVDVGSFSDVEFTISNEGDNSLVISNIAVTGDSFNVNTGFSGDISPNSSRIIGVRFSPSDVGSGSASLQISSNDTANPQFTVNLTGIGMAVPEPVILTPPVWIQGFWTTGSGNTYEFTSDDVIVNGASFKAYNAANAQYPEINYSDNVVTGTQYVVYVGGTSYNYTFDSLTADTMNATITTFGSLTELATVQP